MSLPTIENSFTIHTTKGIQGFDHAEYPVIRLALAILNAMEGYLWVSVSSFTAVMIIELTRLLSIGENSWIRTRLWGFCNDGCRSRYNELLPVPST